MQCSAFSRVKESLKKPEPPGKPSVDEQKVDSLRLSWSAPSQDGGSAVTQYIVEMRTSASKKWKKAESTKEPTVTLFNLVPGETFIFRVRAENKVGLSEPSAESEAVQVKELTKPVEEPKQISPEEDELGKVDYDKLDAKIEDVEKKAIDVNRMPNDLEAKYTICEELGQGAYGTVYRAIEKATGKTWAAKMVQVRPGVKREDVLHEISVMNQLHHDKLLQLHEAFDLGSEICLIEEL
ncbi:fibronectin type III domain protein [Oesophagostomum dentatum]|uniref:Fibronectin type III domain protein n=1 Tax=Oesophagostomum dentatum TaxID=61180 RepID=A0A0B1SM12_OESDE|nr:fibronectin type III domain protein [Oesophagostomum dentatum]